jgi:hypothetical protein
MVTVEKMRQLLLREPQNLRRFRELVSELQDRIIDELKGRAVLSLNATESDLYRNPFRNWEPLTKRFPNIISDVEEANKCLALSRFPACVFHSLQIVESGCEELGRFIGVVDPKSGFTAVTNELNRIIRKKRVELNIFEKDNFDALEQIHGSVEGMKNAWRNKISHVQGRLTLMTKDFSPEVAEEILIASRAFMRRLLEAVPGPKDEPSTSLRPS